ncbi:hypothetical protein [Metabacillus arenae]
MLMISVGILVNISMLIRLNENSTKAPDKKKKSVANQNRFVRSIN